MIGKYTEYSIDICKFVKTCFVTYHMMFHVFVDIAYNGLCVCEFCSILSSLNLMFPHLFCVWTLSKALSSVMKYSNGLAL